MQQASNAVTKFSKEVNWRSLHGLKRERPSEQIQTSRFASSPHEVYKQSIYSFLPTVPSDAKRPRLHSIATVPSIKLTLKLSGRSPYEVLEECLKLTEIGDKLGTLSRIREYFGDHLSVLSDDSQVQSVQLLIQIAITSKVADVSNTCLQYAHHICTNTKMKQNVWDGIVALLTDKTKKESSLLYRPGVYASLLALYEWALSESLTIGRSMLRMNCIAEESIQSPNQNDRIAAINFFVMRLLRSHENRSENEFIWLEELLSKVAEDRDSRVRIAAIKGLRMLATSGRSLSFHNYQRVKNLCGNSSKIVRTEALHILKVFADRLPETEISARNGAKLRLVDDAFAAICHAINDAEVSVRAVAARLLGDFKQVSDSFLDQTLDKKLLNAMRMSKTRDNVSKRPQSYGLRHQRSQTSSEWSTGKKLGEDVPVERFDEEQASIISSGACGAFVTALEDEFMMRRLIFFSALLILSLDRVLALCYTQTAFSSAGFGIKEKHSRLKSSFLVVRQAGVYSLGRLAADRPFLAAAALDHLADMFNDEIEQVRLDAVRALTPLVVHGILQKEQLDTILTVLDVSDMCYKICTQTFRNFNIIDCKLTS
ncbi:unnamed protein product [Thelazia callipaeda]|uniref:HEAT repeat-containing protein 1 n=1 Tax=Thelazia callipaeda TaxID=103827 RepID=A0A0N5D636_THECL|nr:unnamed protein product [Thelazia callipaeda]